MGDKFKNELEMPLEILTSRKKLALLILAGISFSIIGFSGALNPKDYLSPLFRSMFLIQLIGITSFVFFGIGTIFILRKFFNKKPGLIINEFGIINNTNISNLGLIEWKDIIKIEKKQIMATNLLIVHTSKPAKYINRCGNIIVKKIIKLNYKTYGSPISINSNTLDIDFNSLEVLIYKAFKHYK